MATKELVKKQGEFVDAVTLAEATLSWIESLNDAALFMLKNDMAHQARELIEISNYIIGFTPFGTMAKDEMSNYKLMIGTE